jgi:hypothetical protein
MLRRPFTTNQLSSNDIKNDPNLWKQLQLPKQGDEGILSGSDSSKFSASKFYSNSSTSSSSNLTDNNRTLSFSRSTAQLDLNASTLSQTDMTPINNRSRPISRRLEFSDDVEMASESPAPLS